MNPLDLLPRSWLAGAAFAAGIAASVSAAAFVTPVRDFVRDRVVTSAAEEKCVAAYELEAARDAWRGERLLGIQRAAKIEQLQRAAQADAEALKRLEAKAEADRERESELVEELDRLEARRGPPLPRLGDLDVRLRNR